ncbi:methylenetetrahydrofolate reductase [soil metagenome]
MTQMEGAKSRSGAQDLSRALGQPRFELLPLEGAEEQATHLPGGAKVTVTCSPARGLESTLQLAGKLSEAGFHAVPHLSARLVHSEAHLEETVRRLEGCGVREVFVIGGDAKKPVGEFSGASGVLGAMDRMGHGFEEVGVAGYPEGHPIIADGDLWRALHEKQRYATYIVTQMCFDPGAILNWVSGIREQGIGLPVYVGLPGVLEWRKLLRISLKIGVGDSASFLTKNAGVLKKLLKSHYSPDDLVETLAPYVGDPGYNIRGVHFYPFNQTAALEEWRRPLLKPTGEVAT